MKVWITKYAVTKGIIETDARLCATASGRKMIQAAGGYYHGEGRDYHLTRAGAVVKANRMVRDKIKSLQKQLHTLSWLKFE